MNISIDYRILQTKMQLSHMLACKYLISQAGGRFRPVSSTIGYVVLVRSVLNHIMEASHMKNILIQGLGIVIQFGILGLV